MFYTYRSGLDSDKFGNSLFMVHLAWGKLVISTQARVMCSERICQETLLWTRFFKDSPVTGILRNPLDYFISIFSLFFKNISVWILSMSALTYGVQCTLSLSGGFTPSQHLRPSSGQEHPVRVNYSVRWWWIPNWEETDHRETIPFSFR